MTFVRPTVASLFLLAISIFALGCASSPLPAMRAASDATAMFVNDAEQSAMNAYKVQQMASVQSDEAAGHPEELAVQHIMQIRAKWGPVWQVFAEIRTAHMAFVSALNTAQASLNLGKQPDWSTLMKEMSALTDLWQKVAALMKDVGLNPPQMPAPAQKVM